MVPVGRVKTCDANVWPNMETAEWASHPTQCCLHGSDWSVRGALFKLFCRFSRELLTLIQNVIICHGYRKTHQLMCMIVCHGRRDLCTSPNIVRIVKQRRPRWAGHVIRIQKTRDTEFRWGKKRTGGRPLAKPRKRWKDLSWISRWFVVRIGAD
jgi:hypothetical protein